MPTGAYRAKCLYYRFFNASEFRRVAHLHLLVLWWAINRSRERDEPRLSLEDVWLLRSYARTREHASLPAAS